MTVPLPEELSRARYELEAFMLGGQFDLYEDGRFLSTVEREHCSAEASYGKLILCCWGDEWSRSWRVVACEASSEALRLECSRQMGRTRSVVSLCRSKSREKLFSQAPRSRNEFTPRLARLIEANLPETRVEKTRLRGLYNRLIIKERGKTFAGIGAFGHESQSTVDASLGAGLIWFKSLSRALKNIEGLMIFVPRGRARTIAARLMLVEAGSARISLYEVDDESEAVTIVSAFDQGDLADNLKTIKKRAVWPRTEDIPPELASRLQPIIELAPGIIEARIDGAWVELSVNGLTFARASVKGKRVEFGIETKRPLREPDRPEFQRLVLELAARRSAGSTDTGHYFYRARAEKWLETILRKDVNALDPLLDPRYAYSQVPTYRGEQRTYIDLLGATRTGRLVVMELKVAEDAESPFQGLDYWMRVEWHRLRGDFARRGYFAEITISDEPPLLYLIAPLFRFHKTTGAIAGAISSRAPVYRIGINTDWRTGVRVLLSERLN